MAKKDLNDIKVQELEVMVRQYKEEREIHDNLKQQTSNAFKVMNNTATNILDVLEHFKMKTHKTVYGKVTRNERWGWKMPKEDDGREALRKFMEEKGVFDSTWGVHAQTLNSRAKEWLNEAVESGEDADWTVPGLGEATSSSYLSFGAK